MHVALGGQNKEAIFWFDNMIARGVRFDIIGLSFYPRWHGTLDDLKFNLNDLLQRYNKPLNVVEYSEYKREVHEIVFNLPNNMGKGAAIWEPLRWGELIIDYRTGEANERIKVFEELRDKYLK
jgi:arabinogalactan endo-1,4-beta-galactosidase